jgi:hypothetical protein
MKNRIQNRKNAAFGVIKVVARLGSAIGFGRTARNRKRMLSNHATGCHISPHGDFK